MPTFKDITLSLVSQFDILTLPEYAPPELPTVGSAQTSAMDRSNPSLLDPSESIVSVFVPIYPSSMFWLAYKVRPAKTSNPLFYFKLFLNGQHVVSWGCSKKERFQGKVAFGLFDSERGNGRLARRMLSFAPEGDTGDAMGGALETGILEVRVFRALGRRRELAHPGRLAPVMGGGRMPSSTRQSIVLRQGGNVPKKHPRDYYQFALADPIDTPFITFRFLPRHLSELEDAGVTSGLSTSHSSISIRGRDSMEELDGHSGLIRRLSDLSILKPQSTDTTQSNPGAELEPPEDLHEKLSWADIPTATSLPKFRLSGSPLPIGKRAPFIAQTSPYPKEKVHISPTDTVLEDSSSVQENNRPITPSKWVSAAGTETTPATTSSTPWPKTILRTAITRLLEGRAANAAIHVTRESHRLNAACSPSPVGRHRSNEVLSRRDENSDENF